LEPGSALVMVMKGAKAMELLIIPLLVAAWFILQAWVLPRFGVKT
jgi:hypothetical protein